MRLLMIKEPPHSPHFDGIRIATLTGNSLSTEYPPALSPLGLKMPVGGGCLFLHLMLFEAMEGQPVLMGEVRGAGSQAVTENILGRNAPSTNHSPDY